MTEEILNIMFDDLNEDMQKHLLELYGISEPKEMNWDIFPLATMPVFDLSTSSED